MISAFPLLWPIGQPRTVHRTDARFDTPLAVARDDLLNELRLLHTRDVIISTNLALRRDGFPYADSKEPSDPGVAVYFDRRIYFRPALDRLKLPAQSAWKPYVIACDTYRKLVWNLRAVGVTVAALRTIQRHGASSMLEQAFTGFAALPPAGHTKPWWEVLGVDQHALAEQVRKAFLELTKIHHPDTGGSHERMAEINAAYEQFRGGLHGDHED